MILSYKELLYDIEILASKIPKKYEYIQGIPRGGSIIALALASRLQIPIFEAYSPPVEREKILVVDDLIDSGKTLGNFLKYDTAVLYRKPHSPKTTYFVGEVKDWIEFPYEKTSTDIEGIIIRMLEYIGENPVREGLEDTPKRIVKSWEKLYGGYNQDFRKVLSKVFTETYDQMVISRDIELYSTCEHHMLPFYGKCHVAYIPNGKVVGISKLARLVEVFARRLQIQERLTEQIAHAIDEVLQPKGVGVIIEAKHLCMMSRGIEKQNSEMITSCMLGDFRNDEKTREEMMRLCLKQS